ncbi:MAG TPA: DNA polymerase IV, partial [Bryobacteraceae bacterium]|nr:DNA polymerase IV [Bryobacteraceae bacterium]
TRVASAIREQIRIELQLTASAGVATNKFLAKIASDWRKPNGLFVIQPYEVESFLSPLPVARLPGVGKVTEKRLLDMSIRSVADLREVDEQRLVLRFGSYGTRLYHLARGIDPSVVVPNRPTRSISAEDTFEQDARITEIEPMIRRLAEKVWNSYQKEMRLARTVVLKFKTGDFRTLTRSQTPAAPPDSYEDLICIALELRDRAAFDPSQQFRLVGVGLSNFQESVDAPKQEGLFESKDS